MHQLLKKRNWLLTAALLVIMAEAQGAQKAKNVILFLADAGGIPTVNAASILGYGEPQKLFVQSWKHIGLSDTSGLRLERALNHIGTPAAKHPAGYFWIRSEGLTPFFKPLPPAGPGS